MSQFASTIGGSLLGPVGALGGGVFSALSGMQAQKRAQRANEQRYRQILAMLQAQGESSKNDVRRSGEEERGAIAQSTIGRGLYNSSVLDSLNTGSRERESRSLAGIDESVARNLAGVMQDRTDAYPDQSATQGAFGQIGQFLANQNRPAVGGYAGGQMQLPGQQDSSWLGDTGMLGRLMRQYQMRGARPAYAERMG